MANRTVEYQGKKVEAEVVDFTQDSPEAWNQYTFSDGSTLKMKTVLLEIVRVVGEYGPNGDPVYIFTAQQISNVIPAENLKQPKK